MLQHGPLHGSIQGRQLRHVASPGRSPGAVIEAMPGRELKPMKGHDGLYELRVNYQFRLTFRLRADHVAELTAVVNRPGGSRGLNSLSLAA